MSHRHRPRLAGFGRRGRACARSNDGIAAKAAFAQRRRCLSPGGARTDSMPKFVTRKNTEAALFGKPPFRQVLPKPELEQSARSWAHTVSLPATCCTPTTHHRRAKPTRTS
eukprot:7379589-Prymnesium_polylepis.1